MLKDIIKLILDYETYYDKDVSLTKLSYTDYVNHPDFFVYGAAVWAFETEPEPRFLNFVDLHEFIQQQDWDNTLLIAHNTHFDGYILHRHYGKHAAQYSCTMSMARAVLQGAPHASKPNSLETLSRHYGREGKHGNMSALKGKRILTPNEWKFLATYAVQDARETKHFWDQLHPQLPAIEHETLDLTLKLFCIPKVEVDIPVAEEARNEDQEERTQIILATKVHDDLEIATKKLSGDTSFANLLREAGIEPPTKEGKKGQIFAFAKTDPAFQELLEHEDPYIAALARARQTVQSTITITRAERLIREGLRGELPICLLYAGAHTWRWSGGNKLNPQNLVRGSKLRLAIRAPEGYVLVVVDLAQIEVRVLYYLCRQDDGLELFRNDIDPYNDMATAIFGFEVDRKNNPDHFIPGFVGKCVVLGCGFYMGWRHFKHAMSIGAIGGMPVDLTDEEAQRAVYGYRDKNDMVVLGWGECDRILKHMVWGSFDRYESTLRGITVSRDEKRVYLNGGTFLHYPDLQWNDQDNQFYYRHGKRWIKIYSGKLMENIVQAEARNVMRSAMVETNSRFPIVTTTHDETVSLAREEDADGALEYITKVMTTPPIWLPGIPLDADGGYARNYSK